MSFKPDEGLLLSYVYGELAGDEREQVEQALATDPTLRARVDNLKFLRAVMGNAEDKEVIAPPIVIDNPRQRFFSSAYFKIVTSIAASLIILILVGKATGLTVNYGNSELRIGFGEPREQLQPVSSPALTADQVQAMINQSVEANNQVVRADVEKSQAMLQSSVRQVLQENNSHQLDQLVKQVADASRNQVRDYVLAMQTENSRMVKDYMSLTAAEQRQYVESLLVDFSKYMQQQRTNDLMTLQTRLNTIEQNTDLFKQETEQILTSIITSVDKPAGSSTKY